MWYPWTSDFDRLLSFSDLFRQFDRVFRPGLWASGEGEPAATLLETPEGYELDIEVPGVSQKDMTVDVQEQTITVTAKRELKPREGWSTHRAERSGFSWKRSYSLPTKLDPERTNAKYENGVLMIKVAKAPEAQPRRVKIGMA